MYLETSGFLEDYEDSKVIRLEEGMVFHIPPFYTHRFMAKNGDVELIEVSTHQIDDVVRLRDDYGR